MALIEGDSVDSEEAKGAPSPHRGAKPWNPSEGRRRFRRPVNRGGKPLGRPGRAGAASAGPSAGSLMGCVAASAAPLLRALHPPPTPGPLGRTAGPAAAGGPGLAPGVEKLALPLGRAGPGLREAGSVVVGGGEGAPAGAPGWGRKRVLEGPAAAATRPGLGLLAGGPPRARHLAGGVRGGSGAPAPGRRWGAVAAPGGLSRWRGLLPAAALGKTAGDAPQALGRAPEQSGVPPPPMR